MRPNLSHFSSVDTTITLDPACLISFQLRCALVTENLGLGLLSRNKRNWLPARPEIIIANQEALCAIGQAGTKSHSF